MEDHAGTALPDDFLLPDGAVVQFRMNSSSPFCIRADDGALHLFSRDREMCEVRWIRRPAFYDRALGENRKMVQIGQIGGRTASSSATRTTAATSPTGGSVCSATSCLQRRPMTRY